MHSRTKASVSEKELLEMIQVAGIKDLVKYEELTGGEFNLAFMLYTPSAKYILKIGPKPGTITLTHEQNIMDIELWAYDIIGKRTNVIIPKIIHSGHEVIGNHWFIMSELSGVLLCDSNLTDEQRYHWDYQFGQALAQIHSIKNDTYGFQQVRMHSTWKDAYYDMIFTLMEDADAQGNMLPDMPNILRYIRKWEAAFDEVTTPRLIHFDLFTNNVFTDENGNFTGLIDTERCFFGDYYADFFAINCRGYLRENVGIVDGYNASAEEKITFTPYARARVALSRLLLGVIMFTEGTTRLAIGDTQHWKRKYMASTIIHHALGELDDIR